ncbi:MAG: hypothetical protein OQL05_11150 [Gammaproteobacteria bacterium]|nr:hypothetical protein [Gammaproteobacteria bacterium]MCW8927490.1 hypothetical protein [Gammaproteobacteria bacterium]MCW8957563.1 hypothetical protein [Gammaproteobacteria bacterium]MCW8973812.1 hypothetical protein [Gammaproteobacteria bacterium]MCW8993957.1 hypothetical protein [Gammaproteobacteria bacterium]
MRNLPVILTVLLSSVTTIAIAAEPAASKIARAQLAAHPAISHEATIVDVDGTVLRPGSNGWTCMPGIGPGDNHPMCNDKVWKQLMAAAGAGADFSTDSTGISYMLQGDAHVSNSNPAATDPNNGDVWVQEGPHLMIVVPREALKGLSDNPYNGGPYVMWRDTPYAHIMVPIRPTE